VGKLVGMGLEGDDVGAGNEGADVGDRGELEGVSDGCCECSTEGPEEGCPDAATVGTLLGEILTDGTLLGRRVGGSVG
jgi:hypothetical protein